MPLRERRRRLEQKMDAADERRQHTLGASSHAAVATADAARIAGIERGSTRECEVICYVRLVQRTNVE